MDINKAVKSHGRNVVLDGHPLPISNSEKYLTRKECSTKIRIFWTPGLLKEQNQEVCKPPCLYRLQDDATWCQSSLCLPDHNVVQLSRGERPRLKWTWTERWTTSWGKQKETLMATYKAVMRLALEYASSIWSPLASSTSMNKLQVMQNTALRTATWCTQDTSILHLHGDTMSAIVCSECLCYQVRTEYGMFVIVVSSL